MEYEANVLSRGADDPFDRAPDAPAPALPGGTVMGAGRRIKEANPRARYLVTPSAYGAIVVSPSSARHRVRAPRARTSWMPLIILS